jgi:type II secretory pathway predicted ATPase ExeA
LCSTSTDVFGNEKLMAFQPQADALSYENFFGLTEKPFSLNADPRFLYHSPSHAATFENLLGGIRRREGLLVLTGEIGTGKTMLCHAVLRNLGRKTFSSFVRDPYVSREDLLKMLLIDFGVMSIQDLMTGPLQHASRTELSYLLSGFLESLAPLGAFVVVIIDEAQNMSLPLIEETRILSDSFGGKGHLQIVFVGQPELHAKLKLPEMRQVDQRVCGYNRLDPLSHDAVAGYIQHRLLVAGGRRERVLFSPDAIDILHLRSGGVPRLINRICDRALHLAHRRAAASVNREILETALIDLGRTTLTPTWASIMLAGPAAMEPPSAASATPLLAVAKPPPATSVSPEPSEVTASSPVYTAAPVEDVEEDEESFSKRVDEWLLTHDLPPSSRKRTPLDEFANERHETPATRPSAGKQTAVRRQVQSASSWRDVDGALRSETYMKRLGRVWAKRIAIAAVCVVALNVAVLGASRLSNNLTGLITKPLALPELPAQPTLAVPSIVPPAAPPIEAPQAVVSGEYLVAVGLFASRERADRLVQELTQAGLGACQRPFQLRGQSVQQVVLGPFAKRSDAVADLQRLRQRGGHDDAQLSTLSWNHPRSSCTAMPGGGGASGESPLRVASGAPWRSDQK